MQHSKLLPPFISFAFLFICYSANSSTYGQHHKSNFGMGTGTITCLIDGKQNSHPLQGFKEISLNFYSKGATDGILFANGDDKSAGFQFKIKKSGTTKINQIGTGDAHCIINYYNADGVTYTGRDVTVAVTSYTQSHVTGSFSGKLVNVYFESGAAFPSVRGASVAKNFPEFIQITNGIFDITQ